MLWRSDGCIKTCQLQKWYGRLTSQKRCWLVSVCLSNHDKSVISQKLKYQVKTPSKHNIAWIASFKGLQAFRFFSGLFTVFNLSCIKKKKKNQLNFDKNKKLHTIFRRIADFSWWYILFLSSLQEKQSSELFWLISERVRHFRPKVALQREP